MNKGGMQGQQQIGIQPQRKIIYQQGPPQSSQSAMGVPQSAGYHPSYHRMHHAGPPSGPVQQPMAQMTGPFARLFDIFDAFKQEFENVVESLSHMRSQKDEYEAKINHQLHEMAAMQQNVYELERAYKSMKSGYEEDISRLKQELAKHGASFEGHYTNGPANGEPTIKRMRTEEYTQRNMYPDPRAQGYDYSRYNHPQEPPAQYLPPAPRQEEPQATWYQNERFTGVCDLDPEHLGPEWKKGGSGWSVTYNPASQRLQQDRIDLNVLYNIQHDSVVCVTKFSNDGKYLATGCNKFATVIDVETGQTIAKLADTTEEDSELYVRAISFNPQGTLLATGSEDRVIRVWDLSSKEIKATFSGHEQDIYSLEWSKDGDFLYSGSGDRTIRIWDVEAGSLVRVIMNGTEDAVEDDKEPGVTSLSVNPIYPRCLAAGSLDRSVRIWDVTTGSLLEKIEGHTDSVYSVAFSPEGTSIVSGSLDRTVRVWDLTDATLNYFANNSMQPEDEAESPAPRRTINNQPRHVFAGHKDFVLSVAFAGMNSSFGRVDENGDPVATPGGDSLAEVEWIVSSSKDRSIIFWDAGRGAPADRIQDKKSVAQFVVHGHSNSVISIALSPVGGIFASGSGDHLVRVWRVSADKDGAQLPPAGPVHHSQTSSQASLTSGNQFKQYGGQYNPQHVSSHLATVQSSANPTVYQEGAHEQQNHE